MIIPALKVSFSYDEVEAIKEDISEILNSGILSLGERTIMFQKAFADYVGRRFAIAVNSGTTALEIFLRTQNIEGKTIIVPTNTNYATVAAVIFAGGEVKLVDSDLFPSLDDIEKSIDANTVGIIVVHLGGYIAPHIEEIVSLSKKHGLFLLEDAAHAHGAVRGEKKAGIFGQASAFSFFPTKVITSAEGGMLTTDDPEVYEKALCFRDQGKDLVTKQNVCMGNSWRISEIHAAIGYTQLRNLDNYVAKRNQIMRKYAEDLSCLDSISVYGNTNQEITPSGYKFIVQARSKEERNYIRDTLKREYNISLAGGVYEIPIHRQPIFKKYNKSVFPVAENFCSTHLCLPIWPDMEPHEVDYVSESLKKTLGDYT